MLIDIGAGIEAISAPGSGGVPNGTALQHAAVFGMTDVVDVLVAAGAKIHNLEMAATAGGITGWPLHRFTLQSWLRAVIDRLVAAGTPVNEPDAECERLPLHTAAVNGRGASVRRLLAHCADPNLRDPKHDTTPLEKASEKAAASRRTPNCWRRPAGASCLRVPDQAGEAQPDRPGSGPEAS